MYEVKLFTSNGIYQADILDGDGKPIYITTECDSIEACREEASNWITGYHSKVAPGLSPVVEYSTWHPAVSNS